MWTRFLVLVFFQNLDKNTTKELLSGMDDDFLTRMFSPGLVSVVTPTKSNLPVNRDMAYSLIEYARKHPFHRPDMPHPLSVSFKRIVTPTLALTTMIGSLAISLSKLSIKAGAVDFSRNSFMSSFGVGLAGMALSAPVLLNQFQRSLFKKDELDDINDWVNDPVDFPFRHILFSHPIIAHLVGKFRRYRSSTTASS